MGLAHYDPQNQKPHTWARVMDWPSIFSGPWASHLSSLSPSFFVYEMQMH